MLQSKFFNVVSVTIVYFLLSFKLNQVELSVPEEYPVETPEYSQPEPRHPSVYDHEDFRLPENSYRPIEYDIFIEPNFATESFSGDVEILLEILDDTSYITLHCSKDLDINVVEVAYSNGHEIFGVTTQKDGSRDFLIIKVPIILKALSLLKLKISFERSFPTSNKGFYLGYYEYDGKTRMFGATQFQPHYAREAFPCFDEPEFKATFKLSVKRDDNLKCVSNMPIENSFKEVEQGKTIDVFEASPKMSTYLLAFFISDNTYAKSGIHEVYTTAKYIQEGRAFFALNLSQQFVPLLEKLTKVEFGLKKLTHVAVPDVYFDGAGMENWGLILYKQRFLLSRPEESTFFEEARIAMTVAHEIAHQWFGNLITPIWWNQLWLSEGFASYYQYFLLYQLKPSSRFNEFFVVHCVHDVMKLDARPWSKPMTYEIEYIDQLDSLFTSVVNRKGAAIIRMMEHFLTKNVFEKGVENYVKTNVLGVVSQDDLWAAMQDAVDNSRIKIPLPFKISEIMKNWTLQSGVPVLHVSRNNEGKILLNQYPFSYIKNSPNDDKWLIPVNYATNNKSNFWDTKAMVWLGSKSILLDSVIITEQDWIVFNKQQAGYYRVFYDAFLFERVTAILKDKSLFRKIHPLNRAQIIDDTFEFAKVGSYNYSMVFDLMQYLSSEDDPIPLYTFFKCFEDFNKRAEALDDYEEFKEFTILLLEGLYFNLAKSEPNTFMEKMKRQQVARWMCELGHANCRLQLNTLLRKYPNISPDLKQVVYCGGMILVRNNVFNTFMTLSNSSKIELFEKERMLHGLGCTRTFFDELLEDIPYRSIADQSKIFFSLVAHESGRNALLQHFNTSLGNYLEKPEYHYTLKALTSSFFQENQIVQIEEIILSHNSTHPDIAQDLLNNLQETKIWVQDNKKLLSENLINHYYYVCKFFLQIKNSTYKAWTVVLAIIILDIYWIFNS